MQSSKQLNRHYAVRKSSAQQVGLNRKGNYPSCVHHEEEEWKKQQQIKVVEPPRRNQWKSLCMWHLSSLRHKLNVKGPTSTQIWTTVSPIISCSTYFWHCPQVEVCSYHRCGSEAFSPAAVTRWWVDLVQNAAHCVVKASQLWWLSAFLSFRSLYSLDFEALAIERLSQT